MDNQKLDTTSFSSGFATANMIISIFMVYIMNRSYRGFQVFLGFHVLSSFILFIASLDLANGFLTNYLLTVLVAFCLLPMFHLHEFWIIAPTPAKEVINDVSFCEFAIRSVLSFGAVYREFYSYLYSSKTDSLHPYKIFLSTFAGNGPAVVSFKAARFTPACPHVAGGLSSRWAVKKPAQ